VIREANTNLLVIEAEAIGTAIGTYNDETYSAGAKS
jgi:hypothetical protein